MIAIKSVLVATDFSPASVSALAYGRALAQTFCSTLHVLHVVENLMTRIAYGEGAMAGPPPIELQAEIEGLARKDLEAFISDSDRRELHAISVLRVGNNAAKEISEYAKEAAVDIIVIGATGRGMIDRFLTGSVADKVIRRAPCPVLAVRHPEHEFLIPDALQVVAHKTA